MNKLVLAIITFFAAAGTYAVAQTDSTWNLSRCIEYAFANNIQVRKSEISNQRYGLYASQAKAQRLPSANAAISQDFSWSKNSGTGESGMTGTNGSGFSLNAAVTIYNASRISNLIKQANLDIQGGQYDLETARESISLNIMNAYLQVLYATEQVKNSRKQIESTEGQLSLAGERLELKAISQSDYSQVKAQLAGEKLTLANSESQLALARVNLMQLMELPVTADFRVEEPALGISPDEKRDPDVNAVFEKALGIKPQVKGAAVRKEIAAFDEKIAKAGYIPTLSASAGISSGYSSNSADLYLNQLNKTFRPSVGFTLSIPVYQKSQVKTSVAVARLGYIDAELNETDVRNQLRKSIEQACQDVVSAQSEYAASLEKYKANLESSLLSDEKFTQGIINSVDYLVQKTNLIVSESQLLQSKYNLIFCYKILDFYMGVPLLLHES